MHHGFRRALGMVVVLALAAGEARAQYYGGYGGWGGWGGGGAGSTAPGSILQGAGYAAIGAGIYNLNTAQADSINADTIMRWNQFMFMAQQEANQREYLRRARIMKRDAASGDAIYTRIRDNPTAHDVQNGDALNAILGQLTDPKVHSTALRLIRSPVSGKAVKEIPFENASEGVTLSLHQLSGEEGWPTALQGPDFAAERKAYQEAISKALKEDEAGTISPQSVQAVNAAAARLRTKLEANKPLDKVQYAQAVNYIKALSAMSRMLEKPQVDKILAELDSVKETSLGSLLAFMHSYNLRFGPATTDGQRSVYSNLYPLMAEARDRTLKNVDTKEGDSSVARANPRHSIDFFSGLHLEHLEGGSSGNQSKP